MRSFVATLSRIARARIDRPSSRVVTRKAGTRTSRPKWSETSAFGECLVIDYIPLRINLLTLVIGRRILGRVPRRSVGVTGPEFRRSLTTR